MTMEGSRPNKRTFIAGLQNSQTQDAIERLSNNAFLMTHLNFTPRVSTISGSYEKN